MTAEDYGHTVLSFLDLLLGAVQDLEAAHSDLPVSEETPRWLVTESKAQTAALSALRLPFLEERLEMIVDSLTNVQNEQLLDAIDVLATFRPILNQFQGVARQTIDELSSLHLSTTKMLHHLSASLLTIGKEGFCTPPEETTGGNDGEKLEGGDIFGDGEGAENVSGEMNEDDIASDTESNAKKNDAPGDDSDKDALDADDSEMEGKTEDVSDVEGESDEESEPELDEDVGDVDEGEPSKIDEKRWDDGESTEKKTMETADTNNAQQSEDQVANEGENKPEPGQDELDHAAPEDEDEEIMQNELDDGDDNVQDSNNLDLPDDINLDSMGQDDDMESDDLNDSGSEASDMDVDDANDDDITRDQDDVSMADIDESVEDAEETSEKADQDENPLPRPDDTVNSDPNAGADANSADQSNATGLDANEKRVPQQHPAEDSADREAEDGGMDAEQQIAANEDEKNEGDTKDDGGVGRAETAEHPSVDSMKKLGDFLEEWVRQSRPIQASQANAERASMTDLGAEVVDYEHIEDDTKADAQAMDVATRDEATALDQNMDSHADQGREREEYRPKDTETQELNNPRRQLDSALDRKENNGSFIGSNSRSDRPEESGTIQDPDLPDDHHVSEDLSNIHLSAQTEPAIDAEEASRQWARHEQATRALASVLAEQLRLVLAPTHAAKLRGDFKTGKRLNMRRIVPYIASSFKRDKIWMRRSVPSKRRYQIMIALDDSRSMRDDVEGSSSSPAAAGTPPAGGKVDLALQTLALVARALSILEAGSTCFLGFGERVTVAHPFGAPFAGGAGGKLLGAFRFAQDGTDVPGLLRTALGMLRDARRAESGAGEDVWQLLIVVGDGICEDHDAVRRMVRRAREERVMCVFVVVDCGRRADEGAGAEAGARAPGIMELQTARFAADEGSGEMRLVRARYMDTFPFEWWVVVRDVRELPGVLSSALKQWFREIAHVPM
jgi:midasin